MDTSTGNKSSRFPVQGGHPILTYLAFCVQIESQAQQEWPNAKIKGLVDTTKSFSHVPSTPKEDNKTPWQQWMSLLVAQHPILHDD